MGTTMGGVSGVGADRGGLRMGWLAAFSAAGYDDEPPLLEELGINFSHIKGKVRSPWLVSVVERGGEGWGGKGVEGGDGDEEDREEGDREEGRGRG